MFIQIALKKHIPTGKILANLEKSNGIDDKNRSPEIRKKLNVNHIPENYNEVENIIKAFNHYYTIDGCPTEEVFIETAFRNELTEDQIWQKLKESNDVHELSSDDDSDFDEPW